MLRSGGAGEVCLGIRELRPQGNNFATNRTATGAVGDDASSSVTWGSQGTVMGDGGCWIHGGAIRALLRRVASTTRST